VTFDGSGQFATTEYGEGSTLTFGDQPFSTGEFANATPGEYAVGIMAEDMDGKYHWFLGPITVK
jgi:hypothetical protein